MRRLSSWLVAGGFVCSLDVFRIELYFSVLTILPFIDSILVLYILVLYRHSNNYWKDKGQDYFVLSSDDSSKQTP